MYPIKFKAAVLVKKKKPLLIKNINFYGPLKKGQVLVKISYSGICGKQIDEINGIGEKDKYIPHCLGHEGTGVVLDIGPGVKRIKKGENVILHWIKSSGINSDVPKYYDDNKKIVNAGWVTTFNEFAVVSENRLTPIAKKYSLKDLSVFGCALPTGVGTIFNIEKIKQDESVALVGVGGVGIFMLQALKILKIKKIICIDIKKNALKLAGKTANNLSINFKDKNLIYKILKFTNGKKCNYVFLNTGSESAIKLGLDICSKNGVLTQVGVPRNIRNTKINMFEILHGKKIQGSMGGRVKIDRDMKKFIKLYEMKKINIKKTISKIYNFENINLAIKQYSKSGGKILIKF